MNACLGERTKDDDDTSVLRAREDSEQKGKEEEEEEEVYSTSSTQREMGSQGKIRSLLSFCLLLLLLLLEHAHKSFPSSPSLTAWWKALNYSSSSSHLPVLPDFDSRFRSEGRQDERSGTQSQFLSPLSLLVIRPTYHHVRAQYV